MKKNTFYWRVNYQIRASKVRVLGADGKQIGVLDLDKALAKADKVGLDLVEIAPKANPPVVKMVDIGKFRYQEEKKLRKQKKNVKISELKEIRFSPFIASNDYNTRLERTKKFLEDGNKIKIVVKFRGKQMGSKKFGYDLVEKIFDKFGENINIDMKPKFVGRHLTTVISPITKIKKKENAKTKNKKNNN